MPKTCRHFVPDSRPTQVNANEIQDYINRAPKPFHFDGMRMIYNTHARLVWLADIARGTLNERINRRAGIQDKYEPWKQPCWVRASNRHRRNELRKRGLRAVNP